MVNKYKKYNQTINCKMMKNHGIRNCLMDGMINKTY